MRKIQRDGSDKYLEEERTIARVEPYPRQGRYNHIVAVKTTDTYLKGMFGECCVEILMQSLYFKSFFITYILLVPEPRIVPTRTKKVIECVVKWQVQTTQSNLGLIPHGTNIICFVDFSWTFYASI